MKIWNQIRPRFGSAIMPLLTVLMLAYFGYHALEGDHGMKAWLQLTAEKAQLAETAADIRARREALENKVALLKPDNLDPDLLAERVREMLGFSHENEVILFHEPEPARPAKPENP